MQNPNEKSFEIQGQTPDGEHRPTAVEAARQSVDDALAGIVSEPVDPSAIDVNPIAKGVDKVGPLNDPPRAFAARGIIDAIHRAAEDLDKAA